MHLAQDLPVRLQLWLPDGLLAQLAATWNHEVSSTDIGCELANVLAGRLLMQRATAGAQGHMGLPRDGGATAAPQAAQGWWRCAPHGLHLALLPETGS
jgi:hypothetical protein